MQRLELEVKSSRELPALAPVCVTQTHLEARSIVSSLEDADSMQRLCGSQTQLALDAETRSRSDLKVCRKHTWRRG